jgi:hypothetical protein
MRPSLRISRYTRPRECERRAIPKRPALGRQRRLPSGGGARGSFRCSFRSSDLLRQVKGWRHFDRRRFQHNFRSDVTAAKPNERERRTLSSRIKAREPMDKTGGRSDVRQEYVRLREARSGFEPIKRTGASPSCLMSISRCLSFQPYPFGSPRRGGCGAYRRARESAFRPAMDHYARVPVICQGISEIFLAMWDARIKRASLLLEE